MVARGSVCPIDPLEPPTTSSPPTRQGARPGRRGAAAGGHHASDVDRRHPVPLDQGCRRRGSASVGRRSNRQIGDHGIRFGGCVRQDVRARRHRPTFCRCSHAWRSARTQRLMRRAFFWPHLAAASAPTAERRMKPACRAVGRKRQRLEDIAPNNPISEECWISVSLPPPTHPITTFSADPTGLRRSAVPRRFR